MQINEVSIKINYKNLCEFITKLVLEEKNKINYINLDKLLDAVNRFLQEKEIDEYMDIQIKYQNRWRNICEVFGNLEKVEFHVDIINNNYQIQLLLLKSKTCINYNELLKSWQEKIVTFNQKYQQIQQKYIKNAEMVQDQYGIDLAFFYAQPIVSQLYLKNNPTQNPNKEVSFILQVKKIFDKLSNQHAIRSAKIQIKAATISNLQKALSKGVKILHFSCHGRQDLGLEIQGQGQHFAVVKFLKCFDLIQILTKQKRIPEIIVFNACQSDKLAQQIHQIKINANSENTKHITTIGYSGEIKDVVCEKFAETFYSKIFKGEQIQDFFIKSSNETKQVKIFYQSNEKIRLKPSKIKELNRYIDIKNKLKIENENEYFPKLHLYKLMTQMLEMKHCRLKDRDNILYVTGQAKIGKTKLVDKALSYLWQRDQMKKLIKIQLRESKYIISNILQFTIKLNELTEQLKNNKQSQYLIIVIDNCEHIMKYQRLQFVSAIKQLYQQHHNTDFMTIIITSENTSQNFKNYHIDEKYTKQMIKKCKSYTPKINKNLCNQIEYIKKQSQSSFLQLCTSFIHQQVAKLPVIFLQQLPLISIFPSKVELSKQKPQRSQSPMIISQKLSKRKMSQIQNKSQQQHTSIPISVSESIIKQCQKKIQQIQLLYDKILSDKNSSSQKLITIFLILKQMQLIIAIYFLRLNQVLQFQERQAQEKKQKQDICNLIRISHKFINVCLGIKIGDSTFSNTVRQLYETFQFKLYFIIYYAYSLSGSNGQIGKQTTKKLIKSLTTLQERLQILQIIQQSKLISQRVLDNEKQKNKTQDKFENAFIQKHLQHIEKLKLSLQKQYDKQKLLEQQKYYIQQLDLQFLIFDKNSKNLLMLPLLPIIKSMFNNRILASEKVQILMDKIQEYSFITQNQNIYANLFKHFYEDYIECLFELEKLKLSIKDKAQMMKKSDTIDKLNQWIKICHKENFISLMNKINNYKNLFLNYFVALVSFPTNKVLRFQHDIMQMVWKACQNFKYSIFPRINSLTKQVFEKYNQSSLPIPIALFVADTIEKQRKKQRDVFFVVENYNGRNEKQHSAILSINQLNFFKCEIAIFCGKGVKDNIPMQKLKSKIGVCILIDTNLQIQRTNNEKKKKQKISDNDDLNRYRQIFDEVSTSLIIRQMLINFYGQLCKRIFKQKFNNRCQQITKSILIAKDYAYICCQLKFGIYFHKQIQTLFDKFKFCQLNENMFKLKPITLSHTNQICHNQQLQKVIEQNKDIKKISIIENLEEGAQIGYCQELYNIMETILNYCNSKDIKKTLYLMLVCKNNEKETFMKNLNIKLRKMGILQIKKVKIKQEKDDRILNLNSSCLPKIETIKQEQNVLQIIQLQKIDDRLVTKNEIIQQIKRKKNKQQKLHIGQSLQFARIILYFSHQFLIYKQNIQDQNDPQLQSVFQEIQINKISKLQNLVPMIYRRLILQKCELTQIDKTWPNNEINYVLKKLTDIFNQKRNQKAGNSKYKQLQKLFEQIFHLR